MKKLRLLIVMGITICCLMALVACQPPKLEAPTGLEVEQSTVTLSWDEVEGAVGYTVQIKSVDQKSEDSVNIERDVRRNQYSLESLTMGDYKIKVKALGDLSEHSDSKWTSTFEYYREYEAGFSYRAVNNGTAYEVAGIGSAKGDVVMETYYRGKPVISIGASAFAGSSRLTSLKISEFVTSIGARAFYNCSYLTNVDFGENSKITSIGENAFQSCRLLGSKPDANGNPIPFTLPEGVTEIAAYAFSYCRGMQEIEISDNITKIGDYAFSDCSGLLSINIPDSVTSLGMYAFANCNSATSLTMSQNITSIGEGTFTRNASLTSVEIGKNVTSIGGEAFSTCESLEKVTMSDNVTYIGYGAFYDCVKLDDFRMSDNCTYVGAYCFSGTKLWEDCTEDLVYVGNWVVGCKNPLIENVELEDGTAGIGYGAFMSLAELNTVLLPESGSCKYVNDYAFYMCRKLVGALLDGVEVIGTWAFAGCETLTQLIMSDCVTSIGDYAFASCLLLKEGIEFPDTLTSIGTYAFYGSGYWSAGRGVIYIDDWVVGCKSDTAAITVKDGIVGIAAYSFFNKQALQKVVLPETIKYIGRNAFYYSPYLSSINIPTGVTRIEDYTFYYCVYLNYDMATGTFGTLNLHEGITYIGRSAFYGVQGTKEVVIPSTVKYIGKFAFYQCPFIETITFNEGLEMIDSYAFCQATALKAVDLPDSLVTLGDHAFYECTAMTDLDLGTVPVVGTHAFYKCAAITAIEIPDETEEVGMYAFYKCEAVEKLTLGKNLKVIGNSAFFGCEKATGIYIPAGIESIGRYAFRNCKAVKSYTVNSTVDFVGNYALYGNNNLTIYTDAASMPNTWEARWNSTFRPILWGCTLSEDKTYVVSFTRNDDTISNYNATNGISEPTRAGYTFGGWSKTSGGTTADYTAANVYEAPAGTTLYAIWTAA